jgi:folate-dependent phosphoribosylglycinamide formyltransferase PurN
MRVAILCQEEPVFMAPFLRRLIAMRPDQIAAVFVAGRRSAGEKRGTRDQFKNSLKVAWYIWEPFGLLHSLALQQRGRLLGRHDPRSVEGLARKLGIPVHTVTDANTPEFHRTLREIGPDVVLNQSELLLKQEVLSIPRVGFINRHASLLPHFRGRLASFWSHAANPPRYGTTIHFVDEGIDTGPIILQREFFDIPPTWSYPRVLRRLMDEAPAMVWEAIDRLEQQGFEPLPNNPVDKARRFPGLKTARKYGATMAERRGRLHPYHLVYELTRLLDRDAGKKGHKEASS